MTISKTTAALLLLFLAGAAGAQQYQDGYQADGYTYRQGYWWWGNSAYTRAQTYKSAYWYCGRYYPAINYWTYTYSHEYKVPIDYKDPGWRGKLLDAAKQKLAQDAKILENALEQQYYMQAVKEFGLQGALKDYGLQGPYSYSNLTSTQVYGGGGTTLYQSTGVSYNTLAQVYGDNNVAALFQQYGRLTENAQNLGGKATSDFAALIGQEQQGRSKVAELLAKAEAVKQAFKALENSSATLLQQKTVIQTMPYADGGGSGQASGGNGKALADLFEQSASNRCASCHNPQNKKGGFNVYDFRKLDPDYQAKVVERITTSDEAKRMPRLEDGRAGPRVPSEEIQAWVSQMGKAK